MRQGHQSNYQRYPSQSRGKRPTVEVRTQLPLQRGRQSSTSHALEGSITVSTPEPKGEYVKEETPQELKMSVMWRSGLDQLTMYTFDPEAQEMTTAPREVAHHILSDPIEGRTAPPVETRRKTNSRDPRRRSVTLASPSTLYGRDTPPVRNSSNAAQSTPRTNHATDFLMEESDGGPPLVIDIVNIESE